MVQLGQQPGLLLELTAQPLVGRKGLFDGDRRIQPLIHGFVDCAHPAGAQLAHNAIAVLQDCAGAKHLADFVTNGAATRFHNHFSENSPLREPAKIRGFRGVRLRLNLRKSGSETLLPESTIRYGSFPKQERRLLSFYCGEAPDAWFRSSGSSAGVLACHSCDAAIPGTGVALRSKLFPQQAD